jgi:CRP-like cAMP-binding protein
MFQPVLQSLQSFGTFSEEELSFFESKLSAIKVPKNEFLLREGKVCQAFYFLLQGSCTHTVHAPDGTDRIVNLYVKNSWLTDYQSFTSQKPAMASIQAFSDCELALLDIHSLHALIQRSASFFKAGKLMQTLQYVDITTLGQGPEDQYRGLLSHRPELLQAFPLKLLAAYLRITPETLSRFRKRIR